MGKRLFLSLAVLAGLLLAADPVEPHVSFSSQSKVGAAFLPPDSITCGCKAICCS
jgi:hypothetical protein